MKIPHEIKTGISDDMLSYNLQNLNYNTVLVIIWAALVVISVAGIISFRTSFLDSTERAKEEIIMIKATNITAEYYFTYFSLFVLTFFTIEPTELNNCIDMIIFVILFILLIFVYIVNSMYFINPVLNIIGYRSFSIVYVKEASVNDDEDPSDAKHFETKVFSKHNLVHAVNKTCYIKFSSLDFSVCDEDTR